MSYMHKLIITAHPNPKAFTHRIADIFVEAAHKYGHQTRLLNLYDASNKQEYLQLDEQNQCQDDPMRKHMHDYITRADEIIFVYPMRWYDAPAILKNRFDVNMTSAFAYKYKKGSLIPHRLLKGKIARVFITTGSPKRLRYTPAGR